MLTLVLDRLIKRLSQRLAMLVQEGHRGHNGEQWKYCTHLCSLYLFVSAGLSSFLRVVSLCLCVCVSVFVFCCLQCMCPYVFDFSVLFVNLCARACLGQAWSTSCFRAFSAQDSP